MLVFRNGFIIETPKKSFTVYATIAEEKRRWMQSITQNAETAKHATGSLYFSFFVKFRLYLKRYSLNDFITPVKIHFHLHAYLNCIS